MSESKLEKVIKALEQCREGRPSCDGCPYDIKSAKCLFLLHSDALELLKEYKRQDGCPCTHCMEWDCDEVCEEYKKWKDS